MADLDRTVRVSGLPTDIEDDRLSDKLLILFLRERNGGGEIISVVIVKDPPGSALITFEDSSVARRVIQHGQHVLSMNDKHYELTLTHCEHLKPDMVILEMSVTIDCNQLQIRRTTRRAILESYPDLQFREMISEKLCDITGPYCQVQAALTQLFGIPRSQKSEDTRSISHQASSDGGLDMHSFKQSQAPESQLRKPYNSKEYTGQTSSAHTAGDHQSTPRGHPKSTAGPVWEDVDNTETGAMQLSKEPKMLDEDLSLVMDADMFLYLQRHCGKEYRRILRQNGVEVFDATSEGVTTLFLQCETKSEEVDSGLQQLRSARSQLSQLYQDNEAMVRRVHLLKDTLPSGDVLRRIMENLKVTHPKLLLNEDDQNIYLVGSYSDTYEAMHAMRAHKEPMGVSDQIGGGHLRSSSLDSTAHPFEGPSVVHPPASGPLRVKTDILPGLDKGDRRADGATKHKLAAQFKHTGRGAFGSLPALGPFLGSDVLSGAAMSTDKTLSRQNTGEDVLSEGGLRPSQSSASREYERMFSDSQPIPTAISPSGSVTRPPLGTGLSSNCDSSTPEVSVPKVRTDRPVDDAEHTGRAKHRVRDRANSFSHLNGKDRSEICRGQIVLPSLVWKYITEVYQPQLIEVTAAVTIEEQHTDGGDVTTLLLAAQDPSSVGACQTDLEDLVAKVTADFSKRDLSLTELGISDPADEILRVCCVEVQSRFKKVYIHTSKGFISILGPEHLCSQVASALREVFSGASAQIPGQQKCFSNQAATLASASNEAISTNISKDQHSRPFDRSTTVHKQEPSAVTVSEHRDYIQRSDALNVSLLPDPPMAQKETAVNKEKEKRAGTTHSRRRSTVSHTNTITDSNAKPPDDSGPQTIDTSQDVGALQKESHAQSSLRQDDNRSYGVSKSQQYPETSSSGSNSGRGQRFKATCVYCSSEDMVKTFECGIPVCPACTVTIHAHCTLCPKKTHCKGIQGSIVCSTLSLSLEGCKDSTLKITYHIPDGIQGDGHPSPGSPFKGGDFEAYLPDNAKGRRLVPRLQEAFKRGFTFTVRMKGEEAYVVWSLVPHKTSIQGGKSKNGYPDVTYLGRLSDILADYGIQ